MTVPSKTKNSNPLIQQADGKTRRPKQLLKNSAIPTCRAVEGQTEPPLPPPPLAPVFIPRCRSAAMTVHHAFKKPQNTLHPTNNTPTYAPKINELRPLFPP